MSRTVTITNPCGHQVTWELMDVRDDLKVWFTRYTDGEGNEYSANHPGPGTAVLQKNCPQCNWHRFVLTGR